MDVLKNVRLLRDNNVAVLFEENNLNTLDTKTSEMLLTTLSAVAQQESENISEHVKLGLQMKMNRGENIFLMKETEMENLIKYFEMA